MSIPQSPLPAVALGHEKVDVGTSAVGFANVPTRVKRTMIRTLGQPINWRDDGQDPDGSTGMTLLKDEVLIFDADPNRFKMIRTSAATGNADVRVSYYG